MTILGVQQAGRAKWDQWQMVQLLRWTAGVVGTFRWKLPLDFQHQEERGAGTRRGCEFTREVLWVFISQDTPFQFTPTGDVLPTRDTTHMDLSQTLNFQRKNGHPIFVLLLFSRLAAERRNPPAPLRPKRAPSARGRLRSDSTSDSRASERRFDLPDAHLRLVSLEQHAVRGPGDSSHSSQIWLWSLNR